MESEEVPIYDSFYQEQDQDDKPDDHRYFAHLSLPKSPSPLPSSPSYSPNLEPQEDVIVTDDLSHIASQLSPLEFTASEGTRTVVLPGGVVVPIGIEKEVREIRKAVGLGINKSDEDDSHPVNKIDSVSEEMITEGQNKKSGSDSVAKVDELVQNHNSELEKIEKELVDRGITRPRSLSISSTSSSLSTSSSSSSSSEPLPSKPSHPTRSISPSLSISSQQSTSNPKTNKSTKPFTHPSVSTKHEISIFSLPQQPIPPPEDIPKEEPLVFLGKVKNVLGDEILVLEDGRQERGGIGMGKLVIDEGSLVLDSERRGVGWVSFFSKKTSPSLLNE
jgi:hypothetical protein